MLYQCLSSILLARLWICTAISAQESGFIYGSEVCDGPRDKCQIESENKVYTVELAAGSNEHADRNWYIDAEAEEGPCNIKVIDSTNLSQEDFIHRYAYTIPVIINLPTDYNKEFYSACEKEKMLEKYGNKVIRLSSANTHSYRKRDVTLEYYIREILKPQDIHTLGSETFYWFGDNNHTEWKELFDLYKTPHVTLPNKQGMYSFGMAGAGTGVPFHWHGPGFGEVVFGRKRWFLFPPENTPLFNPDRTTLYWLMNEYKALPPDGKPLECTLKPGQVIYFPDRWWHATLNLDTSIFISTFLA